MILCCGEALIDMIPAPTEAGRDGFVPHPGGAVFNTAIALGRLGARVGMLTGLSNDPFGRMLADALREARVDTSRAIMSDRPTTLAFVRLAGGHASYDFFDENSAGRMLSPADMPDLPDKVSALFFGGISLACEPCGRAYETLLEHHRSGRAVMIDPNIRPGFIADIGRYQARLDRMIGQADIVKLSDEDLRWIFPEPRPRRDMIAALLDRGPSLVIVTRGGEGADAMLADGTEVHAPAVRVPVVDTVGAGDTFNAGVLARLQERGLLGRGGLAALTREAIADALAHGARVAAATVSRKGANPPWAREL